MTTLTRAQRSRSSSCQSARRTLPPTSSRYDNEVPPRDPDINLLLKVIKLVKHVVVHEEVQGGGVPPKCEGGAEAEYPHLRMTFA